MSNTDDFLAHFGVKGMRWGVRNDDNGGSRRGSSSRAGGGKSANDKAAVEKAANALNAFAEKNGGGSAAMADKYGPGSNGPGPPGDDRSFYQKHKTAIHIGAGAAVAGIAIYGGYKYNQSLQNNSAIAADAARRLERDRKPPTPEQLEAMRLANSKNALLADYDRMVQARVGQPVVDPRTLPNDPINIKAGSILRRVSTEDEDYTRDDGFFASHDDADVDRYKAILPTYWKKWGFDAKDGYVVNLRADKDVKAPSRREAYDIYEGMIRDDPSFRATLDPAGAYKDRPERLAQETYRVMAGAWNRPEIPVVDSYLSEVKRRGYNALIDENDAGQLAKNPLRTLDGSMYTIQKSTPLSSREIAETQLREARKLGLVDD